MHLQYDFFPEQILPDNGIKIFAGLPHTHTLGRSMRLRHLRNGLEMPVPFQDRFYDPNYQTMRQFDLHLKPVSSEYK
jgi:hypothetical protein